MGWSRDYLSNYTIKILTFTNVNGKVMFLIQASDGMNF